MDTPLHTSTQIIQPLFQKDQHLPYILILTALFNETNGGLKGVNSWKIIIRDKFEATEYENCDTSF